MMTEFSLLYGAYKYSTGSGCKSLGSIQNLNIVHSTGNYHQMYFASLS